MLNETFGLAGDMAWYLPFLIYFARICDVSIGTVRTILMVGGHPLISAILGFFEVIIWLLAVASVITYLTHPFAVIGYAGGFATGVGVGIFIERRIALGYRVVRAISPNVEIDLSRKLRERGHRVTRVDGQGRDGPIELAYMILRRRALGELRRDIAEIDPAAFVSVSQADQPASARLGHDLVLGRKSWLRGAAIRK